MKSTRKFSKVLSLALALVLALALFPTAVFAADAQVTVKGPDGIDLNGSTVNAYKLLEPVDGNAGVYQETDAWKTFFANVKTLVKDTNYVMFYDETNDQLAFTNPGPGVEVVDIRLNSDLDANYPVNDFLDRLRGNKEALTAIGTWARQYAKDKSLTADATDDFPAATGDPVVSSVTLTLDSEGYYLLATENLPAGVVSLSSVMQIAGDGTNDITLKAQPYDLEKEANPSADTQVGSVVPYTITMPLPQTTTSKTIESAVLTDKLTGADYVQNSFVLTIGQDVYVSGTPTGAQYDLDDVATLAINGRTFTLTFTDAGLRVLTEAADGVDPAQAVLTYNVTVASDGVYVVENDATINIKHGPDQITDTTDDSTKVYLYGVQLQKTFSDNSKDYSNVKFELYDSTGTDKINVTGSNGVYTIADGNDPVADDMSLDANNGTLKITGLGATTYVLKETSTAGGFNTANATIKLVADADNPGQLKTDGSCTVTIDNNAQANAKVVTDGTNTNVLVTFDFLNQKGFTLPSTGGAGTWMFTLGGLALIAIAGTALYVSKKKVTE